MATPAEIQQMFTHGLQRHRAGDLTEAERQYRAILAQNPNHADALHLLGVIASQHGSQGPALELIGKAIALNPAAAGEYYCNYGLALAAMGRIDQAIVAYRQSLAMRPELAATHSNLGQALVAKGRWDDAIAAFTEAIRLQPDFADAHNHLGRLLLGLGRTNDAIPVLHRAMELNPHSTEAAHNLANAFFTKCDYAQAISLYRQALKIRPDLVDSHVNLGKALNLIEQIDDAIASLKRALELRPTDTNALNALGNAYKDIARLPEALTCYLRVVDIDPNNLVADSNRVYSMYFSPVFDGPSILAEAKIWNDRHQPPAVTKTHTNNRTPDRRLRVGYVSPNFRNHCQSLFTPGLLANHDHERFEIFCYADLLHPDHVTDRLRAHADTWRVTTGMTDQALADMVLADRIDILIDLTMHMGDGRLGVFTRKPAPVQVAWLAYTGTTGVAAIEYRLTDPYLDPPGENDNHYSEQSIRLPHSFWCYDPLGMELTPGQLRDPGPPPVQQNGHITFGCLNNFSKINDRCLEAWCRVFAATPNSRLLLLAPTGSARTSIIERLGRGGMTPDRIDFVARQSRTGYLNEFHRIDLCLDTFPCNGHTTSLDSFWMGVPVVTRLGPTAMGRAGLSQLSNLGLTDLAANSDDQFARIAAALAADQPRLADLRRTLRQRLTDSPIMDAPRFARDVEAAYRQMWRQWAASP
jgi:protein O-GlcNAc transferase